LHNGSVGSFGFLGKSEGRSSLTSSAKPDGAWGCVSAIDSNGRTIFVADAHRDDGKRFVVRADQNLTAFLELEAAMRAYRELV
jgi:hypothetical protein